MTHQRAAAPPEKVGTGANEAHAQPSAKVQDGAPQQMSPSLNATVPAPMPGCPSGCPSATELAKALARELSESLQAASGGCQLAAQLLHWLYESSASYIRHEELAAETCRLEDSRSVFVLNSMLSEIQSQV